MKIMPQVNAATFPQKIAITMRKILDHYTEAYRMCFCLAAMLFNFKMS